MGVAHRLCDGEQNPAAKSLSIVQEDGNSGSWLDRAGMMMRAQPH